MVDKTIAPFTLLLGMVALIVAVMLGLWEFVLVLLIWWLVSRAIKILPHLRRRPGDLLILPLYIAVTYYMSLVKIYALLTLKEHKWLTRDVAVVDGKVQRVSGPARDG
jgi:hyaluronan synthase